MNKLSGRLVTGILIGFLLFPASFYLYLRSGAAPVATAAPPLPLEHWLAKTALHAKMDSDFPRTSPIAADESSLTAGAVVYRDNCSVCHGVPNHPPAVIGRGMFPRAPQLFVGRDMITDDPPGETYWKAKNGIRLTGMPGFRESLSENELWQVSLLLASADKLSASVIQTLTAPK
jgi:thiosulfate dehydrogenase